MKILSYDLDLDVDFGGAYLRGLVTIKVQNAENPLELDAVSLEIKSVSVNGRHADFRREGNMVIIPDVPSKANIEISYEKNISDDVIFGIYKSRYGDEYILATDLEPAEARTVFPCKDHPSFKSVFRVKVTTERGLKVISNSSLRSIKPAGKGRQTFVFDPTPPMSTYLLFLAVGKLEERRKRVGSVEVIIASRPGQSAKTGLALKYACESLSYFQRYFGIQYPLKKLHLIGLPEYHTGAMENWGAITSREAYILLGRRATISERRNAAEVIAHEIAHQWFGDLVTMKWWDDLWLNESFATLMEYKAVDSFKPKWSVWDDFMRTSTVPSLFADALSGTHPIRAEVKTPEDAGQVFDAISYGKGASVLRMIEAYIGEEQFRKGISDYLDRFRYSNASGKDLWSCIEKSSGKPVARIIEEWINKAGFPLIKARMENGKLLLRQSRFFLDGREGNGIWPIPLTIKVGRDRREILFDREALELDTKNGGGLKLNVQETGFYSVLYDDDTYRELAGRFVELHKYDKWGILSDLYMFLNAGKVSPETYFKFVSLCRDESHFLIVRGLLDQLGTLYTIANESEVVLKTVKDLLSAQLERLGASKKKGESETDTMLRGDVASFAVRVDKRIAEKFAAMFNHYDRVDPNLRAAVARAYAIVNGESAYEKLAEMAKRLDSEVDRAKVYAALCSFSQPELVRNALELSIGGEVSRSDTAYTLLFASQNPYARDVTWYWLRDRFERLWQIYGGSQQILLYFERVVPRCAVEHEEDVKRFLTPELMNRGRMVFARSLELLQIHSRLRARLVGRSR